MHFYDSIDNVTISYSNIQDGRFVDVRLQRDRIHGRAYAKVRIPLFTFSEVESFTEEELADLLEYTKVNSAFIWELARKKDRESLYDHFCRISATEMAELAEHSDEQSERKFYEGLLKLKVKFPFDEEENLEENA